MFIPLNEFELHIPPQILQRGLDYFEDGRVHDLRPDGEGLILSNVKGNDLYEVEVQIQKGNVTFANCTCPAFGSDLCKHVVAVLFALNEQDFKEGILGGKAKKEKSPSTKEFKAKPKEIKEAKQPKKSKLETDDLVEAASHEELAEWIREVLKNNRPLESLFKARFQHYQPGETTTEIRQRIKEIITALSKSINKSNQNEFRQLPTMLQKWWDRCEAALAARDPEQVVAIAKIIFEENIRILHSQPAFDAQKTALGYILKRFDIGMTPKAKEQLRIWSGKQIEAMPRYRSLHPELYRLIFYSQPDNASQVDLARSVLKSFSGVTVDDATASVLLELITSTLGQLEAGNFRRQNLKVFIFRKAEVEELIAAGKYKEAKSTIKAGFSFQQNYYGKPSPWWDELISFHLRIGDKDGHIETLILGFLSNIDSAWHFHSLLKEAVPPENWIEVRGKLLAKIPDVHYKAAIGLLLRDLDYKGMLEYVSTQSTWVALSAASVLEKQMPEAYAKCLLEVMEDEIRNRRESRFYEAYSEALMIVDKYLGPEISKEFAEKMRLQFPGSLSLYNSLISRGKREFRPGFR